jgi:hypothetical protein
MVEKKYHTRERKFTVTWENPLIGAETSKTMIGLDYLRAIEKSDEKRLTDSEVLFNAEQESADSG